MRRRDPILRPAQESGSRFSRWNVWLKVGGASSLLSVAIFLVWHLDPTGTLPPESEAVTEQAVQAYRTGARQSSLSKEPGMDAPATKAAATSGDQPDVSGHPGSDGLPALVPAGVQEADVVPGPVGLPGLVQEELPDLLALFQHELDAPWAEPLRGIDTLEAVWDQMLSRQPVLFSDAAGGSSALRVDYSDPTGRGAVPLVVVAGRENEQLTPNLRVGDLSASDGAAFARISEELVLALDRIMEEAPASIYISSGYRHSALNANPEIGGAALSQHMAGRAADIWSDQLSALELAALALDVTRCNVAVGLGQNYIHIDVRGYLTSWAREEAEMDEVDFDMWVLDRCEGKGVLPDEAAVAAFERGVRGSNFASPTDYAGKYHAVMSAYARVKHRRAERGAVLLDLDKGGDTAGPEYYMAYVPLGSQMARRFGVEQLIRSSPPDRYFAYIIVHPGGVPEVGIMSL